MTHTTHTELSQLKSEGIETVVLNGFRETIDYVMMIDCVRIATGFYKTV